jgi:ATP-binding cassette subfamily C protein
MMQPPTPTETNFIDKDPREFFLMRLRYREGRTVELGANRPFLLDDPTNVWIVYSGQIDLFVVQLQDHQVTGPRHHLMRIPSGHALFGMNLQDAPGGLGLLAVATVGTRVITMKLARLVAAAQDPLQKQVLAGLIDEWIVELSSVIAHNIPPKDCLVLQPGVETFQPGNAAVRAQDVLWVRHLEGESTFLGRKDLAQLDVGESHLFPISKHTWVESLEGACVAPIDTVQFLSDDPDLAGLGNFHAIVLSALNTKQEQESQAEREMLRQRHEADNAIMQASISELVSVIPSPRKLVIESGEGDPLFLACRRVGLAQGIEIFSPPARHRGAHQRDPLGDIAKASRMRIRQVTLNGEWWRHESGALLGSLDQDQRPVALLPVGRRYEMWDPVANTTTKVDRQVADTLAPAAFAFYRPLPDGALTMRSLINFGMQNSMGDFNTILLMGALVGLLALFTPIATSWLVDKIIPNADRTQLIQVGLALLACAIATAMFNVTQAIAVLRLEAKLDLTLQSAVWDRLLNLPIPFFRQFTAGDLTFRALGINMIRQVLTGVTLNSMVSAVFSVFSLLLMMWYNWRLSLVAMVLVLIVLAVIMWASNIQMRHQRELTDFKGIISGLIFQLIIGVSKLRVASAETRAFAIWAKKFVAQKKLAFWIRSVSTGTSVFSAIVPITTSLILFAAIYRFPSWNITPGSFVGFNAAFGQFVVALGGLNMALMSSLSVIPLYNRMKPILETIPEVDVAKADPGDLTGAIEVSHVSFRYTPDGPLVLDDVSLYAKPGEFVAVVGPSGSGKSTLFRMLLGFETPENGAIYYDGQDLATLDIQAVRRQTGVVLQTAKLMTGDIFHNIVGSSRLSMDDAWQAAKMVALEEDIKLMPMGMFTVIMEGGGNFSGGQRQRLLIARAIVTKPRILLFDEATSALDNVTQEQISASLESLQSTRLIIAHRLSTIMNADRIYVIVGGKVVQTGTYNQLLNRPGPFADLVRRQLA